MAVDVLKVTGDYKIVTSTDPSARMTVDSPELRVTGNLTVLGSTTTVETANMTIEDNIIVINQGEQSVTGVTLGQAGIQIDRGPSNSDATFLYDDTLSYIQPNGATGPGVFTFKVGSGLVAIQTHVVETQGEDLILLGQNAPTAVVSVTGTSDYETRVTDDDDIPNKKYVDDSISGAIIDQIIRGNTTVSVRDTSEGDPVSDMTVAIDGVNKLVINGDTAQFSDLTLDGTVIRTNNSGDDLLLESNGAGEVVVRDVLSIEGAVIPSAPSADSGRLKLYSQSESAGGSGLYFVNTSSTRDELVSKRKAILYSMLF